MRSYKSTALMALAATASLAMTACGTAPIPVASNFEYTSQYKARSAGHWDIMARDVVLQTLATLEGVGIPRTTPIYIQVPYNGSEFDQGFRDFLITKMVHSGVSVLDKPDQAELLLSYNTQVVVHNSHRPHFVPGQFTMLAGGLMAAYGLRHSHLDTQLIGALGLAGAADFANSINSGGPTHTEVILTTSVKRPQEGQYLARKTDVYYLEDVDAPLFLGQVTHPVKTFNVVDR